MFGKGNSFDIVIVAFVCGNHLQEEVALIANNINHRFMLLLFIIYLYYYLLFIYLFIYY